VLTKLATDRNTSTLLQNLIDYKEVLIQITLPFDSAEPKVGSTMTISPTASPSNTILAQYISRAPLGNPTMQGKTYFYHANTTDLRTGMQVNAVSNTSKGAASGVIIPNTAVVWYGGKAWVYRKTGNDQFSRLPVNTDTETENGWFYKGNLKPNDQIVTSGAQLLLSEEFKYQITNENED
jgi:multidrug efflux pump subunit AcrA (membrane-fusion protein)